VFISSHLMSEMENTADHLIVIGRGKLIAGCPMAEFIAYEIRSVRSAYITLLAQAMVAIAWAILDSAGTVSHWTPGSTGAGSGFDAAQVSLMGQVALGELIIVVLGVIFLIPALAQALPNSWFADLVRWLPGGQALSPIASSAPPLSSHLFSAWGEFAVFSGYAAVLLAIGAWLFIRRDA
jgi:hypothetical protein